MSRQPLRHLLISALFLLSMTPLRAQLDPKLVMSTDSMDVYKNPTTVKPEIITLIDMTGSTAAVTWHPNYTPPGTYDYNADNQTTNLNSTDSTTTATTGYVTLLNSAGGTTFSVRRTAGGTLYTNVTLRLTVPLIGTTNGVAVTAGSYIMADGTTVENWLLQTAQVGQFYNSTTNLLILDSSSDTSPIRSNSTTIINNAVLTLLPNHRYFAKYATHGRMTSSSRTIDIPLPWRIFDSPGTATSNNQSTSSAVDPQSGTTIIFDTRDGRPAVSGGMFANDVCFFNDNYFSWIFAGTNVPLASANSAWSNGVPTLTRLQAIKRAVLSTWMSVQTKVFWAVTALDSSNDTATVNSNPTGTSRQVARILQDYTSPAISWLQGETSSGTTPLTYGMARAYAEMVNGSVFAASRAAETALNPCRKHFVILFTDGLDSGTPGTGDPFLNSTVTPAAPPATTVVYSGVTTVKGGAAPYGTLLNSPNSDWNIWSMAGCAANGNNMGWSATQTSGSGSISKFAPFSVVSRDGGSAFAPAHPIETLTIGLSLFGDVGTAGSSKRALLLAAGYGKAGQTNFNSANYIPYTSTVTGSQTKVRFWDAQNAATLSTSIIAAIQSTMEADPTTSSPVAPLSGMKAGDQVYFARYKAEQNNAPLWSGDLMMVRTQVSGTTVTLKGLNDADLTNTEIKASNAIWAASNVLGTGGITWNNRKVYTYFSSKAGTDPTTNRYASLNQPLTDASCSYNTANTALLTYMTGKTNPTAAEKTAQVPKIEWMLGKNRTDGASILGDVVNSTPVVIEYDATTSNLVSAGLSGAAGTGKTGTRLRMIFVGTNHGFLHAFAEASYLEGAVLKALATELWAFVPPEFVKGAYEQLNSGTDHVYMVDGPAAGYLDESTSTAGLIGKVDNANDKALVIFGLGKGGRSTYALDVSDPFSPKLAWALRPDDETDANANPAIGAMGMSTGIPDQARIRTASAGPVYSFKDVLFVGGGLSTDTIDANFGTSVKLGRSVFAVETKTGALYKTWDFINDAKLKANFPSMGSVAAGPMAMEVLSGTNLTQRVYFTDRSGGVYALGSGKQQATSTTNPGFRIDSSDPKEWVDDSGNLSVRTLFKANAGEYITTSPVPFHLPFGYPGAAITGKSSPQAVGVAVGTGDLWDPMDRDATNPAQIKAAEYNRMVVLFDRNDSSARGYDSSGISLTDLTTPNTNIVPTSSDYYLKTTDGYFVAFDRKAKPAGQPATETASGVSNFYYQKIISEPLVFRNVLYFTLLKPDVAFSDGSCSGVSKSVVYRVADVINPKWLTSTVSGTDSGALFTFAGIPGRLSVLGPNLVGVAGTMTVGKDGTSVNNGKGMITIGTDAQNLSGPSVRLRSWRIVR